MYKSLIIISSFVVVCLAAGPPQPISAQSPANYPGNPNHYNNDYWRVNPYVQNPNLPPPWSPYGYFRILRQYENSYPNGYQYSYATENQIQAAEEGQVPEYDPNEDIGTKARGYYQYVGDDNQVHRVDYTADENGFRPVVTILPVGAFNAPEIARSAPSQEFPLERSSNSAPFGALRLAQNAAAVGALSPTILP